MEKVDRNKEIIRKRKEGATYRQLSIEYGLALETVLKIIRREDIRIKLARLERLEKKLASKKLA